MTKKIDNKICLECGKSINKDEEGLLKEKDWTWIICLLMFSSLFGFDGDDKNNGKDSDD